MIRVFVGYDPREPMAYRVCVRSLLAHSYQPVIVQPLVLAHLQGLGLYRRPTDQDADGKLSDRISGAPMSTEFALSRFLVPRLCPDRIGYAVFCDSDFLWRADVHKCVAELPPDKALGVVMHDHKPTEDTKMRGQPQTSYPRKNWSSLMVWNLAHPAHRNLDGYKFDTATGLQLHGFCWLTDKEIAPLNRGWNWLCNVSEAMDSPHAVHYTLGTPDMAGRERQPFADEWRDHAKEWDQGGVTT